MMMMMMWIMMMMTMISGQLNNNRSLRMSICADLALDLKMQPESRV